MKEINSRLHDDEKNNNGSSGNALSTNKRKLEGEGDGNNKAKDKEINNKRQRTDPGDLLKVNFKELNKNITMEKLFENVEDGLKKSKGFCLVINNFDYEANINLKALKEKFDDKLVYLTLRFD